MDIYMRWSLCALSEDGMHYSQGPGRPCKDVQARLQFLKRKQHFKFDKIEKGIMKEQAIKNNIKRSSGSAVCLTVPLDREKCKYLSIIFCIF